MSCRTVQPHQDFGMATIWDADILIWAASILCDMKNRGVNDIPREIKFQPHDLLRAIGRSTGGTDYLKLRDALERLKSTIVNTNIRVNRGQKRTMFSWIDQWDDLLDSVTKESRGLSLTLSEWFYRGVIKDGGVLAIDPAYFSINGGRERWLYRVARKHAGGNGPDGFAISMHTLFEKFGAEGTYRRFKFEVQRIVVRNDLPGFWLTTSQGSDGEPMIHMVRRDCVNASEIEQWKSTPRRAPAPIQKRENESSTPAPPLLPLLRPLTRQLSDRGLIRIRMDFPGWDLYALKDEFDIWLNYDPAREPNDYEAAFYGFVRRHHEKNKYQLSS
jgi:plasmid replication initiation protein